MLKLKSGDVVYKRNGNDVYYVVEVLENAILLNASANLMGANYWYSIPWFLSVFKYEEPFEPCEGDKVYSINTSLMRVQPETFSMSAKYDLEKVFPTKAKADEILNKIKSII